MIASSSKGVISIRSQYCAGASQYSLYDLLDSEPPVAAPVLFSAAGLAPPAPGVGPDPDRRWMVAWILATNSP
jgi:hypothetical protein